MGGWKLEVFRMSLYMAFPVGMFHYFNQPENYEDWVIKVKQKFPKEDPEARRLIQESINEHNRKIEQKRLEAMKLAAAQNSTS